MRILIIHNRYQERGGEDSLVEMEINLLKQEHEVETLYFQNKPGVGGLLQFILSVWNIAAAAKVRKKIRDFRPDIVHVHNWHFAASPIIFHSIAKAGIPVVATLHNYRILCPSATLYHDGQLQYDSLRQNFPWTAVKKKFYRNSYLLSFWLAFVLWFHRRIGTWNLVKKFLIPSASMKLFFESAGWKFPVERILVKPNFTQAGIPSHEQAQEKSGFIFVGRLSPEKGIANLLKAFRKSNHTIKIIGTGPLLGDVQEAAARHNNIQYLGLLNKESVLKELSKAEALIFPSVWQEPFGMVIIESFSVGTPVIGANIGAPATLIEHDHNGLLFDQSDEKHLFEAVSVWKSFTQDKKMILGENALNTYNSRYSPQKNLLTLNEIYQSCL